MAEIWDLYTKDRKLTGREQVRGEPLPDGCFHLVVHVWIRNGRGRYLISQRAADRPTDPLQWECVGGSVIKGENSLEGALREVKEEVGIDLDPKRGKILFSRLRGSIDGRRHNDIMDVWLFDYDGEPDLERATTPEVADCHWMSREEIRRLYDRGKLVRQLDYFFCAVEAEEPDYSGIIGRHVSGIIDRPMGSRHPRHPDMIYPVNYGYVEGVMAGDGEEQDVYVLGTKEPLERFEGVVIGVYHRYNDNEDKWIVAPEGTDISEDEILGEISFQEQYFYGKLYTHSQ